MYKKLSISISIITLSALSMLSTTVSAQNLYMNDLRLKADLDWLNSQGVINISTSTWPLTVNEINRGLSTADPTTSAQYKVLQSIRAIINESSKLGLNGGASLYLQSDREQLPQTFADDKLAGQQADVTLGFTDTQWEANLQINFKNDKLIERANKVSLEGSYVAGTLGNQWLIGGQIPTWWGPGNDGSLIKGDASLPVVGFTMQRDEQSAPSYPYLSWVGPWNYQLFAGQLDDYNAVPETKLFGARLTASPLDWLELGASRTFMWGGEGRPESFSSFVDALLGTRDNNDDPYISTDEDPANQLAGFDAKIKLTSLIDVPATAYAQYIGEDEAGGLPAKSMYLLGADYASESYGKPYQIYAEYADTRTNGDVAGISYNHFLYSDGYYQQGYPLGHALGGDSRSASVGGRLWLDERNFINSKVQYAKVNQSNLPINEAFPFSDTLTIVDVAWEHQLQPQALVTTRVWAVDSDTQSSDIGAGIGIELKTR